MHRTGAASIKPSARRGERKMRKNSGKKSTKSTESERRGTILLPYQRTWVDDDAKLKIVVKARQTGYSFAAALRAVRKCMDRKTVWIFLSKGERQSRLLMEKVQEHARAFDAVAEYKETTFMEDVSVKQLEVRFPNGSVIYGLPANPETARGFTGNVTLDEFAFHADADKIYTALYPSITRGFSLEIISTPNGQSGKFYELAKAAGLVAGGTGFQPVEHGQDGRATSAWSPHRVTLQEAVDQGLAKSVGQDPAEFVNALRSGVDDQAWPRNIAANSFPPRRSGFRRNSGRRACRVRR